MKKLLSLLLALVMVFTLAACAANDDQEESTGNTAESTTDGASVEDTTEASQPESIEEQPTDAEPEVTVLGEGATVFNFVVVDIDGTETAFEIHTDETTVGAALLAVELIAGEEASYGLYVKEVNGIVADWDEDQTYWAFYEDGNYAATGVDLTEIDPAVTYSFVKTAG